jgi:hypothetical protein
MGEKSEERVTRCLNIILKVFWDDCLGLECREEMMWYEQRGIDIYIEPRVERIYTRRIRRLKHLDTSFTRIPDAAIQQHTHLHIKPILYGSYRPPPTPVYLQLKPEECVHA